MHRTHAFTAVELMIVVIVLGIIAAIVIPQFTNASTDARLSRLHATLDTARFQLEAFKSQHDGHPPALTGMWGLLTGRSDTAETSLAAGSGNACGPYMNRAPVNPINGLSAVSGNPAPDPSSGWFYTCSPTQFTILARDESGRLITSY